ncbi:MAG: hypothetical protein HGA19_22885 [Oscillochloris sp.]|nr:hypothetical protein [Oscillochloris sp.]
MEKNQLRAVAGGDIAASGTGHYETIPAGMILRSVGYKGSPLPGVPYETRKGTIPNELGRVFDPASDKVVRGEYVVGWAKRGPSGIIGTNKPDSVSTVAAMLDDLTELEGIADEKRDPQLIVDLLHARGVNFVSYEDWQLLDAYETSAGEAQGRPRVKITRISEMMEIIRAGRG